MTIANMHMQTYVHMYAHNICLYMCITYVFICNALSLVVYDLYLKHICVNICFIYVYLYIYIYIYMLPKCICM